MCRLVKRTLWSKITISIWILLRTKHKSVLRYVALHFLSGSGSNNSKLGSFIFAYETFRHTGMPARIKRVYAEGVYTPAYQVPVSSPVALNKFIGQTLCLHSFYATASPGDTRILVRFLAFLHRPKILAQAMLP